MLKTEGFQYTQIEAY